MSDVFDDTAEVEEPGLHALVAPTEHEQIDVTVLGRRRQHPAWVALDDL